MSFFFQKIFVIFQINLIPLDDNRKDSRPGNDRTTSDFPKRDRGGSTIITNSGDTFFGIPPGASARAHVQNIDLKPFGEDGAISPSEALRRDERRSLRLRGFRI